ncbi:MAG: PepSY-like domain-containing protein [Gemmataceae bacterium]
MRKWVYSWLVLSFVALVAGGAYLRADEEKVPLDKVPKAVMDAVKKKFPDAKIMGVEKEVEGGKTSYEVAIKNKDQNIDVLLTPEGEITAIEAEISLKDLPKEVVAAMDKKYPKATVKKVEEITKDGKVSYEVLLVTADKKTFETTFDPKGKILEEEAKKESKKD